MSRAWDCLVIGGGVAGLMSALEALRGGLSVAIADAGWPKASAAGAGVLAALPPWKEPPPVRALIDDSAKRYTSLVNEMKAAEGFGCELRRPGMLVLPDKGKMPPLMDGATFAPVHWLSPALACAAPTGRSGANPAPDSETHGVWIPEVSQLRPQRLLLMLKKFLLRAGAAFLFGEARLAANGRGQIAEAQIANGESVKAGRYVLCAGSRTARACPSPVAPIAPERGQLLIYRPRQSPMCVVMCCERDMYLAPREDGSLVVGASHEDAGFDDRPVAAVSQELHARAAALFPSLAAERPRNSWSGLRPRLPDGMPLIGAHPEYKNLFFNTGHGRYGLSMGPGAARLLMKIMADPATENPFAFRPAWAAAPSA